MSADLSPSESLAYLTCRFTCYRLTKDMEDLESLSEMGVLFLLFEMGLELSIDRLKVHHM